MLTKSKNPFYMDDHPNYSSQYIFDEAYQNVMKKKRFEKNPKFMYFNTVLKMKNKLENSQHDIYTKVFDRNHKRQVSDSNRFNETAQTWTNSLNKLKQGQKKQLKHKRNISCIQEINFEMISSPRNGSMYSQRPRLDDIMAEYRKMNKTGNNFRQKNFRTTSYKPNNTKLQFLNKQAAKHLPKSSSISIRRSQGY